MLNYIKKMFKATKYQPKDFSNLGEMSKPYVRKLKTAHVNFEGTIEELNNLEKLSQVDKNWFNSKIKSIKELEKILLRVYNKQEISYFYSYKNDHAKREEFRYLINKR